MDEKFISILLLKNTINYVAAEQLYFHLAS